MQVLFFVKLYTYVDNNPVVFTDPFGLDTYYINSKYGSSIPTNSPSSHSFVAITDKGTVTNTYSWDKDGWTENGPNNMEAAQLEQIKWEEKH